MSHPPDAKAVARARALAVEGRFGEAIGGLGWPTPEPIDPAALSDPLDDGAIVTLAALLARLHRFEEAETVVAARARRAGDEAWRIHLAKVRLIAGRLDLLTAEDHDGVFTEDRHRHRFAGARRWPGGDERVSTLLVYSEYDLGDTFQFGRFLRHIEGRSERILFGVDRRLIPYVQGIAPGVEVVDREAPPAFTAVTPLLSVPGAVGLRWRPSNSAVALPLCGGLGSHPGADGQGVPRRRRVVRKSKFG